MKLAARRDRGHDIVRIARHHHTDRDLPIVRCIGGVQRAIPVGEAHLAEYRLPQSATEALNVDVGIRPVDRIGAWRYWEPRAP